MLIPDKVISAAPSLPCPASRQCLLMAVLPSCRSQRAPSGSHSPACHMLSPSHCCMHADFSQKCTSDTPPTRLQGVSFRDGNCILASNSTPNMLADTLFTGFSHCSLSASLNRLLSKQCSLSSTPTSTPDQTFTSRPDVGRTHISSSHKGARNEEHTLRLDCPASSAKRCARKAKSGRARSGDPGRRRSAARNRRAAAALPPPALMLSSDTCDRNLRAMQRHTEGVCMLTIKK